METLRNIWYGALGLGFVVGMFMFALIAKVALVALPGVVLAALVYYIFF